ncbi:hypothetical protein [Streptomyces sp. NPDC095613]|uniref:hypothetical protein n=1 Tax=Streptomyces sp. NPDC095613 TaxID=3155540 RepID=UPI003329E3DA
MSVLERFRRKPEHEPILRALAIRVQQYSRRGANLSCQHCGGNGPIEGFAVLFADRKKRNGDSASLWCMGCVNEQKRANDAVRVTAIPVERERSPIAVIEL